MKENWQEQLQTLLNCDLKTLYPLARSLNRNIELINEKLQRSNKKLKE